jgi:hypothetical protein
MGTVAAVAVVEPVEKTSIEPGPLTPIRRSYFVTSVPAVHVKIRLEAPRGPSGVGDVSVAGVPVASV